MAGVNVILRASAFAVVAGQMPLAFQLAERPPDGPFALPRPVRDRRDGRPALVAGVIGLVRKRQQDQLFAGRKVKLPNERHELDAHWPEPRNSRRHRAILLFDV